MLLHHLIKGCTAVWLKLNDLPAVSTTQAPGKMEVPTLAGLEKTWTNLCF